MSPSPEQPSTDLLPGFQLDLDLEPIPTPNLRRAVHLDSLIKQLPCCADGGPGSGVRDTQISLLRAQLQACHGSLDRLNRLLARVRKPYLWLGLYAADHLLHNAQIYLPPFDDDMAKAVLGKSTGKRDARSLRQAIHLYFMAFGKEAVIQKSGLEILREWILRELPQYADTRIASLVRFGINHWLFTDKGPTRLAAKVPTPADLERICEDHDVPRGGGFFSAVRDEVLLLRLRQAHPNSIAELVREISSRKKERTVRGTCLGAEGIRVLIHRVRDELFLEWPEEWLDFVLTMGCHPEVPKNTADYVDFWHWATSEDIQIVAAGLTRRNVEKFLSMLESLHGGSHYYWNRALFLRHLLKHGKILKVRVIVCSSHYREMVKNPDLFDHYAICHHDQESGKSVIFIQCTDGVQMIEGSESFALGLFVEGKSIPVRGAWDPNCKYFNFDSLITIRLEGCRRFIHDPEGRWMNNVIRDLRMFHIEWPVIRIN